MNTRSNPFPQSATAPGAQKPASGTGRAARESRLQWRITMLFAVMILIPSMYGFVGKFYELVQVFRGEPGGEFAIAPILNYLFASLGFLCMLIWATWNGMFHDVERPKLAMLEQEELLNRRAREAH